jgi:hypothetical protein
MYTHTRIEGPGGGVWRIREKENTAPEDALLVYIREEVWEGRGLGGRVRGAFGIAPSLFALTLLPKRKGL